MPAAQDPFISFCFNLFCSGMQFDLQIKKPDIISKGEMHQSSRCMQLAADRYAADSSYSARRCLQASASLRHFGRKTRLEVAGCRRALAGSSRVISECWQVMREALQASGGRCGLGADGSRYEGSAGSAKLARRATSAAGGAAVSASRRGSRVKMQAACTTATATWCRACAHPVPDPWRGFLFASD